MARYWHEIPPRVFAPQPDAGAHSMNTITSCMTTIIGPAFRALRATTAWPSTALCRARIAVVPCLLDSLVIVRMSFPYFLSDLAATIRPVCPLHVALG